MNPTAHDAKTAIAYLWKKLPFGLGERFNTIITRLEQLESENARLRDRING